MKAIWNNQVIAESDDTIVVERNHYFPKHSVNPEFLQECSTHSSCPWKGVASYYTLEVDGKQIRIRHGTTLLQNPKLPILPIT